MRKDISLLALLLFLLTIFSFTGCGTKDKRADSDISQPAGANFVMVPPDTALEGVITLVRDSSPPPSGTVLPAGRSAACPKPSPLEGVIVTAGNLTAVTDSSGYWRISGIKPGTYLLTAEKQEYASVEKQVSVLQDQEITVNLSMEANSYGGE